MRWYRLKFLIDNSLSNDCYSWSDALAAAKVERRLGHSVRIIAAEVER